ncbi:sulfite exporter TauE/SafE family protein [Flavobacterium beibuense]|uniref:Probable membrane transporter protein n=1 Tax=Flavobacterium beibuense TaxID=657326 RepID=A0A444W9W3_9FLAO|nr:sulfite exporter TauE/SafE family protein [Flavobacterium beibuense]RYJ42408.1 sulfite permease TauE [Flavobacterium beibuense]
MELLTAYAGACAIGLVLGLMGGGGSILTVPLLVYVMGINPVAATGYSLFIVGTTSAFGGVQNYLKGNVAVKQGLFIAVPSFITVYCTRRYIVPAIPQNLIETQSFTLSKGTFIMVVFAIIMLLAALSMLFKKNKAIETAAQNNNTSYIYILPYIILTGITMGLVGAGGGFLIIPMLVFFGNLSMKKAVGTSLLIIAINSITGFMGDLHNTVIDWQFLLSFTAISIFGIFVGTYLHRYVNEKQLKKGFGIFILVMACFIFSKEFFGF